MSGAQVISIPVRLYASLVRLEGIAQTLVRAQSYGAYDAAVVAFKDALADLEAQRKVKS